MVDFVRPHSFIGRVAKNAQNSEASEKNIQLSGLDAVKKIVGTEAQARRMVDEAKARAQQIIARAHEEGEMLRKEAVSSAQAQREDLLSKARERAESDARQSDVETEQLLRNYQKLAEARSASAVDKAVELILNA
jgi:vacuolar-type H+-ATPase subunit H